MTYTILPEPLWPMAECVAKYFKRNWGISTFRKEEAIQPGIGYKTTLWGNTHDHHLLCVEVSESVYPPALDSFVLECKNSGLPVRLFVAIPKNLNDPRYKENLRKAHVNGVGVVEVDPAQEQCHIIQSALALSLTGVRPIEKDAFPAKYRGVLASAEETYRQGTPDKACALIYDELESLTRKIAKKTSSQRVWKQTPPSSVDLDRHDWGKVISLLETNLPRTKGHPCEKLTTALWSRLHGVTSLRNSTGHKPRNTKDLVRRNRTLRTQFESAIDLLEDLVEGSKKLRI
jgi:hypothetical protein